MTKGRTRKPGPRYPSGGHKRPRDRGAERQRQVRERLAAGKDPSMAAYPLGVMCAQGDITEAMRWAGCHYAWLHSLRNGHTGVASASVGGSASTMAQDEREALEGLYIDAREALGSRRMRDAIHNVAIEERWPRWMSPAMPRPRDVGEAKVVKAGLKVLASYFAA